MKIYKEWFAYIKQKHICKNKNNKTMQKKYNVFKKLSIQRRNILATNMESYKNNYNSWKKISRKSEKDFDLSRLVYSNYLLST